MQWPKTWCMMHAHFDRGAKGWKFSETLFLDTFGKFPEFFTPLRLYIAAIAHENASCANAPKENSSKRHTVTHGLLLRHHSWILENDVAPFSHWASQGRAKKDLNSNKTRWHMCKTMLGCKQGTFALSFTLPPRYKGPHARDAPAKHLHTCVEYLSGLTLLFTVIWVSDASRTLQ